MKIITFNIDISYVQTSILNCNKNSILITMICF